MKTTSSSSSSKDFTQDAYTYGHKRIILFRPVCFTFQLLARFNKLGWNESAYSHPLRYVGHNLERFVEKCCLFFLKGPKKVLTQKHFLFQLRYATSLGASFNVGYHE